MDEWNLVSLIVILIVTSMVNIHSFIRNRCAAGCCGKSSHSSTACTELYTKEKEGFFNNATIHFGFLPIFLSTV